MDAYFQGVARWETRGIRCAVENGNTFQTLWTVPTANEGGLHHYEYMTYQNPNDPSFTVTTAAKCSVASTVGHRALVVEPVAVEEVS